LMVFIENIS